MEDKTSGKLLEEASHDLQKSYFFQKFCQAQVAAECLDSMLEMAYQAEENEDLRRATLCFSQVIKNVDEAYSMFDELSNEITPAHWRIRHYVRNLAKYRLSKDGPYSSELEADINKASKRR